jgi:hypothetical protein
MGNVWLCIAMVECHTSELCQSAVQTIVVAAGIPACQKAQKHTKRGVRVVQNHVHVMHAMFLLFCKALLYIRR